MSDVKNEFLFVTDGFFFNGCRLNQKTAIYPKIAYEVKVKQIS